MSDHFYGMPARRRELGNTLLKPSPARVLTTFNAGHLVPIWSREMLPGETIDIQPSFLLRSQTPLHPVADDCYIDLYCFYVPNRLVLDDWAAIMGENKSGYWVDTTVHSVPKLTAASSVGFLQGSVADYYGLPTGVPGIKVNPLRLRGYALIWNEWFRDQNLQSPAACPTNSTNTTSPSSMTDPILQAYLGGGLLPVNRMPDYFSTSTPGPLKATNVVTLSLPDVPVTSVEPALGLISDPTVFRPRFYYATGSGNTDAEPLSGEFLGTDSASGGADPAGRLVSKNSVGSGATAAYMSLAAKTSSVGISINDFRFAVQLQKLLERDLFGTRYTEVLKAHFGVDAQDSRLQRPQLFGWRRYRLNQQQVAQTSATGSTGTPQGNLAAYSLTVGVSNKWKIASPEHGFCHVFACIRVKHTFQQGLERSWSRFDRYDYAWPEFIGIGNTAVWKKEIYAPDATGASEHVWGYQEYAADYRYNRRYTTGQMRSNATGTLHTWHYADVYASAPTLSGAWIADNSQDLIDRSLAVKSSVADQFFGCFDLATTVSTWLPMYSIPGFVDHF